MIGILIFITLLLAIELVQRAQLRGSDTASLILADLGRAVDEAKAERDALVAELRSASESRSSSSLEISRRLRETRESVARMETDARELAQRLEGTEARTAESRRRREDARPELERYQKLLGELAHFRAQLRQERESDWVYYNVEAPSQKGGWLVLIDGKSISTAPLGQAARPTVFSGLAGREVETTDPTARRFLDWAATEVPGSYFLLVVRPSGVRRADLIEKALHDSERPFGFDLIDEGQAVLHPERGVFRR